MMTQECAGASHRCAQASPANRATEGTRKPQNLRAATMIDRTKSAMQPAERASPGVPPRPRRIPSPGLGAGGAPVPNNPCAGRMPGDARAMPGRCPAMPGRCPAMPGDARRCPAMPGDARRCPAMPGDARQTAEQTRNPPESKGFHRGNDAGAAEQRGTMPGCDAAGDSARMGDQARFPPTIGLPAPTPRPSPPYRDPVAALLHRCLSFALRPAHQPPCGQPATQRSGGLVRRAQCDADLGGRHEARRGTDRRKSAMLLGAVIGMAGKDRARAVDLLGQHDAHQAVRPGQSAEGKGEVRPIKQVPG